MEKQTIYTKALLSKISISQFNPKRQDAKITREVLEEKNATKEAGNWMKNLIDPKALDPITSKAQKARLESYRLSSPWLDEGWRVLPIALYNQYFDNMREIKKEFNAEVEKFISDYPLHIENAKKALNGMFNLSDYPTQEQLKNKFAFNVDFRPIESGEDFRVSLDVEELEKIRVETDERVKLAEKQAMKNLWERLAEPIKHIAGKLKEKDSIFRDSIIENLNEILNLIPALNISEDKNLENFVKECKEKLTIVSPNSLRKEKKIRKATLETAEDILKRMEGYIS